MRLLRPQRQTPSHADLFIDRYAALLRQARQLLGRNERGDAEDLVHDAFVRFTVSQPDLHEIKNVDGYLVVLLRNLHVSRLRRNQSPVGPAALVDFDSVEAGLRAVDLRSWLAVRDTLRTLCQYGCLRCRSARSGSFFLLRFFHGFVPSEIALIARTTSGAVDEWIRRARREARAFLADPTAIAFATAADVRASIIGFERQDDEIEPGDTLGLVGELRRSIFSTRHEQCLDAKALDAFGDRGNDSVTNDVLAQVVTCPACLDRVSRRLGIDPPSFRLPPDSTGHSRRRPAAAPARPEPTLRDVTLRQRARETFEHRPEMLHLAVNGHVLGSQWVRHGGADLELRVSLPEPLGWVELFGDQDVCLAMLDLDPPPTGRAYQSRHVALSDGRSANLSVAFDRPWPVLRMTYSDPLVKGAADARTPNEGPASALESEVGCDRRATVERRDRWWEAWRDVRGLRRGAWRPVSLALFVWLFFFTPGLDVSAATHVAKTMAAVAARVWDLIASPRTLPSVGERPVMSPLVAPVVPASLTSVVAAAVPTFRSVDRGAVLTSALQALAVLQQRGSYLGQEVTFATRASGGLDLSVLVADRNRQRVVREALATLDASPGMRIIVQTYDDRMPKTTAAPTSGVRAYEVPDGRVAAYELLAAHLRRTGDADPPLASDVNGLAARIVERSRVISQHVWALSHLMSVLEATPRRSSMPDEARRALDVVVTGHAQLAETAATELRRALQPILGRGAESSADADAPAVPGAGLEALVATWAHLNTVREAAVDGAFVVSRSGTTNLAVFTPEFRTALIRFEEIARRLQQSPSLLFH